jgi:fumarylacetoacetase
MMAQASGWLEIPHGHPFGLGALPYCSFTTAHHATEHRVGVAVGDQILDLTTAATRFLPGREDLFASGSLDELLGAGDAAWAQVRADIGKWLTDEAYRDGIEDLLVPAADADLRLPFTVADYVDFYASEHHAGNIGRMFRPESEPLTPNRTPCRQHRQDVPAGI